MNLIAALALAFTWVTLVRLRRRRSAPLPLGDVLLLRPADALRPEEAELLRAVPEELEQRRLGSGRGYNGKLAALKEAIAGLTDDSRIIVVADADVFVTPELLTSLVTPVRQGFAVAFASPAPDPGATLSSLAAFAVLRQTHLDHRALFVMRAGAPALCGKAFALSPRARQVLLSLDDCIGEDLRLSERLTEAGETIAIADVTARTLPSAGLPRIARWMRVLRAHRPLAFFSVPLLLAPLPWLVPLAIAGFANGYLVAALVASRVLLAWRLTPSKLWAFVLGEPLLLLAFVCALPGRVVRWRGRALVVAPGGRIVEARTES